MVINSSIKQHLKGKLEYSYLSDSHIRCNSCNKTINVGSNVKFCIASHEKSANHKKKITNWAPGSLRQKSVVDYAIPRDQLDTFSIDLTELLVSCNIPWAKLNKPKFKNFFNKYAGRSSPDESTLRKYYLSTVYKDYLKQLRDTIGDNQIYLQVDEAHLGGRKIVSILVGLLNGCKPKSFCLAVSEIKQSITSTILQQAIINALILLWPQGVLYDKLRLLITDQASYCTAAGQDMKGMFPRMLHVTCLCHALNRVCELVRDEHERADETVCCLKKVLARCGRRRNLLADLCSKPIPSSPIETRWGTWIRYCAFINENYDKMKEFSILMSSESKSAMQLKLLFQSDIVKQEFVSIHAYESLIGSITSLETRGLTIYEQRRVIDSVLGWLPQLYEDKLVLSLSKNPDYETVFKLPHQETIQLMYSPLVSVDVERSFSQFKNILTDRRQSMTADNFSRYAFVYYNSNVDDLDSQ